MAKQSFDFGFPLPMAGECWLDSVIGSYNPAPDFCEPFVKNGGGAPKGLSQREHVTWALLQEHPWADALLKCDPDNVEAVNFEINNPPETVDAGC